MRVCLDISAIPYGTGVSLYTANLARALQSQLDPNDSLIFFGSSMRQRSKFSSFSPAKIYPLPPKLTSILFNQLNLSPKILVGSVDIFHTWDWYAPRPNKFILVSTVHDLAMFKYPQVAHPEILAHHRQSLDRLKRFGAKIIAVSQTTRDDLIELFNFKPENITVIPEALPREHQISLKDPDVLSLKSKFNLKKPYFLFVGTKEPRKNLANQISAWRKYHQNYDLVLAGRGGWAEISPEPGLILIDQINNQELAGLYHGASLLLYASLYEGFGLPILEAFYHQLPVVTSNLSGMSEVAGNAAVLVDPTNVDSIQTGIQTALEQKEKFITKGLNRLKHFSWSDAAVQTIKVYQKSLI